MGYGQSYYTLRSIFFDGCPPPVIRIHLRCFDVAKDVPIGDISATDPSVLPTRSSNTQPIEVDLPEEEKAKFELWLQKLWRDKDEMISKFHETGSFISSTEESERESVQIPVELRNNREILDAFCFFGPAVAGLLWSKLKQKCW
jgi:Acyltransferase C-terminus